MVKKLPEIFHNKIDKKLNNNRNVFYSSKKEIVKEENEKPINITQKINKIFSSPNYIYKADVEIKTREKSIQTKIIGRNKKYLITMNNELINISDIIDIIKKTN